MQGKTTFIIAHKFSTIAQADKILLLENGRLAASGAHEELPRTNPGYRELYELRFGRQLECQGLSLRPLSFKLWIRPTQKLKT